MGNFASSAYEKLSFTDEYQKSQQNKRQKIAQFHRQLRFIIATECMKVSSTEKLAEKLKFRRFEMMEVDFNMSWKTAKRSQKLKNIQERFV